MTKKTMIKWRMGTLPSTQEVRELVADGILSKDEAREILFRSETEEDRDKVSLESEIKFLREMVEKLSSQERTKIVEVIREVKTPYVRYDWYKPYDIWCYATTNATSGNYTLTASNTDMVGAGSSLAVSYATPSNFSDIKTF